MTPAPSMPALEALLREVEAPTPIVQNEGSVIDCVSGRATAAPSLAAMLRVAVGALTEVTWCAECSVHREDAMDAIARIERIAAGESGPPEGQALAKGEGS